MERKESACKNPIKSSTNLYSMDYYSKIELEHVHFEAIIMFLTDLCNYRRSK